MAVRRLIASIHDVSPRFEREVDQLIDLLRPHVGAKIALLVVPNHWGEAPLVPGSHFAKRLRGWADEGLEILLHGFFHRDEMLHHRSADRLRARLMTANEGEFLGLGKRDAEQRMLDGRALLEDLTGRPIAGFVAPAWLYGDGALQALSDLAVPLAEDHWRVWSPATGRTLARGPVITWASRTPARLASSLIAASALRWIPLQVLRIGVHPPDVRHDRLVRSIEKTITVARRKRQPASYTELLAA